jgi:cytochrome c oxidase subunit 1
MGVSRRLADGGATYNYTEPVRYMNEIMSWSAWGLALAQIPFFINFFTSIWNGAKAGDNPWDATTLEWQAPSPPPHGNFPTPLVVYHGPYEYSVPGQSRDFVPQSQPAEA